MVHFPIVVTIAKYRELCLYLLEECGVHLACRVAPFVWSIALFIEGPPESPSVCPHAFCCRTIYLCPIFVLYEFHHNILTIGSPFSTSWTTRFLGARGVVFSGVVLSRSWVTCTWAIFFFFLARSPAHCYGLPL